MFWSNDPRMPVGQMVREMGLLEADEEYALVRDFYHASHVPGY